MVKENENKLKRNYRKVRYVIYRETLINEKEHLLTFIGAFLGIGIIGFINNHFLVANDTVFLIGSFGASAVLIYGAPNSPLAQPRNLIGGHLISAFIGVLMYKLLSTELWLSSALAVSTSIVMMQITKTLHPPGGATALIANIGSEKIKALGFLYTLYPVLTGVLILLIVALCINNLSSDRKYPQSKLRFPFKRSFFR